MVLNNPKDDDVEERQREAVKQIMRDARTEYPDKLRDLEDTDIEVWAPKILSFAVNFIKNTGFTVSFEKPY